jgi:hypothetical protein
MHRNGGGNGGGGGSSSSSSSNLSSAKAMQAIRIDEWVGGSGTDAQGVERHHRAVSDQQSLLLVLCKAVESQGGCRGQHVSRSAQRKGGMESELFVGRCVLSGVNYQMRPQKSRVGPFNCHELPRRNVAKCMRSSLAAPPK